MKGNNNDILVRKHPVYGRAAKRYSKHNNRRKSVPTLQKSEHLQSIMDDNQNLEALLEMEEDFMLLEPYEECIEEPVDLSNDNFTLYDLLRLKDIEIPFVVYPYIPEGAITILTGDSDTGKSVFYNQLSLAIVEGKSEFLGLKLKVKYNKVLIINSEDGAIAISVRIKKQLQQKVLTKETSLRMRVITSNRDIINRIRIILQESPVDLVVIDALADVFEEDINSSNATRNFLTEFNDIIKQYDCSVLFVHHIGKGKENLPANKGHMLGSVGIHGKVRSVIMLSKLQDKPNFKTLTIVKGNYVSEEAKKSKTLLEFDPKTLLHNVVIDESLIEMFSAQLQQTERTNKRKGGKTELLKEEAWKLKESGNTLEAIGKIVGRDKSTISKWLKDHKPFYDVAESV